MSSRLSFRDGLFSVFLLVFLLLIPSKVLSVPVAPWEIEGVMDKEAPGFTLKDINGNDISFESFKGNVILVNFWATWCLPCRAEMPSLNSLYNRLKDRGFVVMGISIDSSESPVRKFLKKIPVDFPLLLDSRLEVAKTKYKVFAYPTTFLIDRKGIIKEKFIGEMDWVDDKTVKIIERYLEE
jgi:peroxiredoxin